MLGIARMVRLGVSVAAAAQLISPAYAQSRNPASTTPTRTGWSLDFAATGTVSPGFGAAASAAGFSAAVTLVRTNDTDEFGGHRCLGLTTLFVGTWDLPSSASQRRSEQWVLAGPRWDGAEPGEPYAFLQILGGVRGDRPAAGVGLGFGIPSAAIGRHPLAWRPFEVNWLVAPGVSPSWYRLTIGSGVELDVRLTSR